MIFYLKTPAGWRETTAVEHSLEPAGGTGDEARDTLARFLDRIAERQREARLSGISEINDAPAAAMPAALPLPGPAR